MHAAVVALSEHYNALLADQLTRSLGVAFEQRNRGADRNPAWEIADVPGRTPHLGRAPARRRRALAAHPREGRDARRGRPGRRRAGAGQALDVGEMEPLRAGSAADDGPTIRHHHRPPHARRTDRRRRRGRVAATHPARADRCAGRVHPRGRLRRVSSPPRDPPHRRGAAGRRGPTARPRPHTDRPGARPHSPRRSRRRRQVGSRAHPRSLEPRSRAVGDRR